MLKPDNEIRFNPGEEHNCYFMTIHEMKDLGCKVDIEHYGCSEITHVTHTSGQGGGLPIRHADLLGRIVTARFDRYADWGMPDERSLFIIDGTDQYAYGEWLIQYGGFLKDSDVEL